MSAGLVREGPGAVAARPPNDGMMKQDSLFMPDAPMLSAGLVQQQQQQQQQQQAQEQHPSSSSGASSCSLAYADASAAGAADPATPAMAADAAGAAGRMDQSREDAAAAPAATRDAKPRPAVGAAPRGSGRGSAVLAVAEAADIVRSGYADAQEVAEAEARVQSLPAKTLAAASSLLADLPAPLLPVVIAKSTARRGRGGRQPAADPRLDPNMDPKKARRILANRQSAARSKLKQKLLSESIKARQQVLASQQRSTGAELRELRKSAAGGGGAAAASAAAAPMQGAEGAGAAAAAAAPAAPARAGARQTQQRQQQQGTKRLAAGGAGGGGGRARAAPAPVITRGPPPVQVGPNGAPQPGAVPGLPNLQCCSSDGSNSGMPHHANGGHVHMQMPPGGGGAFASHQQHGMVPQGFPSLQQLWPQFGAAYGACGGAPLPGGAMPQATFEAAFFGTLHAQLQAQQHYMQQQAAQQQQQQQQQAPGMLPPWMAVGGGAPGLWRSPSFGGSCTSGSAASTTVPPQLLAAAAPSRQLPPLPSAADRTPPLPAPSPGGWAAAARAASPALPPMPGGGGDGLQRHNHLTVSDNDDDDGERLELPPNEFGAPLGGAFCGGNGDGAAAAAAGEDAFGAAEDDLMGDAGVPAFC